MSASHFQYSVLQYAATTSLFMTPHLGVRYPYTAPHLFPVFTRSVSRRGRLDPIATDLSSSSTVDIHTCTAAYTNSMLTNQHTAATRHAMYILTLAIELSHHLQCYNRYTKYLYPTSSTQSLEPHNCSYTLPQLTATELLSNLAETNQLPELTCRHLCTD